MGPLQAAGKQQSLEKKWVDVNWGPEDHRSGLGSRQGLRLVSLSERDSHHWVVQP